MQEVHGEVHGEVQEKSSRRGADAHQSVEELRLARDLRVANSVLETCGRCLRYTAAAADRKGSEAESERDHLVW